MKRFLSLFLSAALLLGLLSGCDREPGAPESSAPTGGPAETAPVPEGSGPADPVVEPEQSQPGEAPQVLISEVMTDNRNLILGHSCDWVELYNPGDRTVSLEGAALTDDPKIPDALDLSGLEIPAGGYLAVVLEDTAPFGLSEIGETVHLTWQEEILDSLTFGAAQGGASFGPEGVCQFPTPGYANTEAGYRSYLDSRQQPELRISEVMSANGSYYRYNYTQYSDLIEVQNTSDRDLFLKDYYLTDRWDGNDRYFFPEITLKPGELYVILCSGDPSRGAAHAPFTLTPGETVYLAKKGTYIDALPIPEDLQYDESFGRSGNYPVYLDSPTPGNANGAGSITGIAMPEVNVEPGIYDGPVTVTLSGPGTIYYTTSGTRPTPGYSRVYSEPITLDGVTTLRAICVENGRQSPVANFPYAVGADHDLPVLIISLPESDLYGEWGMHTHKEEKYEYEAVMSLIEDGEVKFSVPMGLRLHGNDSRLGLKKNYKILFKAEYGLGKLEYPLFENRDIDEFNSLLLKGGSEDWGASMIRDELATSVVDGTTALYTQAKKPVVAYIAGRYWGVNHLRERFDEEYVASHLHVSPESVDILSSSAGYNEVGNGDDFQALKRYARTHDMSTNENYAYLCQRIDVTSLIDWYASRIYYGDTDIANIRRFRSSEDDGKWHWMFFDLDWSFYAINSTPASDILTINGGDIVLIQAVLASEAGRDAFLKRFAYLMETILNEAYITEQIDGIVAEIGSEMPADRDRWNRTMSGWEKYVQVLRDFTKNRQNIVLRDLKNYFYLSDSQMEYYFGSLTQ